MSRRIPQDITLFLYSQVPAQKVGAIAVVNDLGGGAYPPRQTLADYSASRVAPTVGGGLTAGKRPHPFTGALHAHMNRTWERPPPLSRT